MPVLTLIYGCQWVVVTVLTMLGFLKRPEGIEAPDRPTEAPAPAQAPPAPAPPAEQPSEPTATAETNNSAFLSEDASATTADDYCEQVVSLPSFSSLSFEVDATATAEKSDSTLVSQDSTSFVNDDLNVSNNCSGDDDSEQGVAQPSYSSRKFEVDVTQVHGYNSIPFLCDPDTVAFIRQSNTMFIMRGLPGSGKSMLVDCIRQTYPGTAVCSADHFFMDKKGNYNYDQSKISEAHKVCQARATQLCENSKPVVVIDNTNLQRWSLSHYFRLAQSKHFYHVIIVEPNTPWRFNVDVLAAKNSHGVTRDILAQKLQSLQDNIIVPSYYGWFLTWRDSRRLANMAHDIVKVCVAEQGRRSTDVPTPLEDILRGYEDIYTVPKQMLHCTANFLGGNRRQRDPYHNCKPVKHAMGAKFQLTVTGFVYSKRAVCAMVDLYARSPSKGNGANTVASAALHSQQPTKSQDYGSQGDNLRAGSAQTVENDTKSEALLNLFVKEEEERLRERYESGLEGYYSTESCGVFKHGCSAHVTIAYAQAGQAKYSGDELLNICEQEYQGRGSTERETSVGKIKTYAGGVYQVTLKQSVQLDCLFHGFYTNSRSPR